MLEDTRTEPFHSTWHSLRQRVSLAAVAGQMVKLRRSGIEWKGCCPFHHDRTPSFTIYADDQRFMCFGCGAQGDALDFIARTRGITLAEALQEISNGEDAARSIGTRRQPRCSLSRSAEAAKIWTCAAPATSTLAQTYLWTRGIRIPPPPSIRFASIPLGRRPSRPALIAAVSTLGGQVGGIQRTYLSVDGHSKADLPGGTAKFSLGRVRGGAIRLAEAGRELILTEGLEDGLTLLQELGQPVWVAAGASMLPTMDLPALVRSVVIGADNDAAGRAAAERSAVALAKSGRLVRIIYPEHAYKDFNAQLLARHRGR